MTQPDTSFNPHDYPCLGFPKKYLVLKNKPLSHWKGIMKPICWQGRKNYFIWRFRLFCEFENIPSIRLGAENMFWYLRRIIDARLQGTCGDGI